MKVMKLFLMALLALSLAVPAMAQEGEGEIDWVGGFVTATGYGTAKPGGNKAQATIKSMKAAKASAQAELLGIIKGVKIDSRTLVEDAELKKEVISARIKGLLKGATIVDKETTWMEDGSPLTSVTMRVCLTGRGDECKGKPSVASILGTVLEPAKEGDIPKKDFLDSKPDEKPMDAKKIEEILEKPVEVAKPEVKPEEGKDEVAKPEEPVVEVPKVDEQPLEEVKKPEEPKVAVIDNSRFDPTKPVTGLIISLRGVPFGRVMYPVVATEEPVGTVQSVYSAKVVKPEITLNSGLAWYTDTLGQAGSISALGENVLTIPATGLGTDDMIMISAEHASLIRDSVRRGNEYLADGKVAISAE